MNAIPTKYSDAQFRSRLEAKWAAFFDLLGWKWEYEPIDLNGYIPDFVICFSTPVLIEVKPFWSEQDSIVDDARGKISSSGWELSGLPSKDRLIADWRAEQVQLETQEILSRNEYSGDDLWAFGYRPRPESFGSWLSDIEREHRRESIVVGSTLPVGDHYSTCPGFDFALRVGDVDYLYFRDCKCGIGLIDVEGCFACKRCGQYDGGSTPLVPSAKILGLWREAGNRVQWNPPAPKRKYTKADF